MNTERYDIFLSYRREGGFETAKHLFDLLTRDGYRVSFDIDTLRQGDFDTALLERIDQCTDFILILNREAFDRTLDPTFDRNKDWMRIELAYALEKRKNIIPVMLSGFTRFPDNLPEDIAAVKRKNGPKYSQNYFDAFYAKLLRFLDSSPVERVAALSGEIAHTNRTEGAEIHIDTDLECRVLLFNKEIAVVRPGEDAVLRLKKGRNKLEFVSTECADDRFRVIQAVEDVDSVDVISVELAPIRQKRLDIERERIIGMFEMVKVAGGTFKMCASYGPEESIQCVTRVTLSGYYIGKYEIMQKQWVEIMGSNPSQWKGDNLPVECVSRDDIQDFLRKLNAKTGLNYRLPTEAEWEFAARGGNRSRDYTYSGSNNIGSVAWYAGNSGGKTHPVGTKQPNELGIYDMTGNVWEWCRDRFDSSYYSNFPSSNPQGPSSGADRVLRGGCWGNSAGSCHVSNRIISPPGIKDRIIGFRLARSL